MRSGIIKLVTLSIVFVACAKSENPSNLPVQDPAASTGIITQPTSTLAPTFQGYQQPTVAATTMQVPCCPNGGQLQFNGVQAACVGAVSAPTAGIGITYSNNDRNYRRHRRHRDDADNTTTVARRNRDRNSGGTWGLTVGFGTSTEVQAIPASTCVAAVNQQMPCDINYANGGDICSSAITGAVNPTYGGVRCYPVNGGVQGYCGQANSIVNGNNGSPVQYQYQYQK